MTSLAGRFGSIATNLCHVSSTNLPLSASVTGTSQSASIGRRGGGAHLAEPEGSYAERGAEDAIHGMISGLDLGTTPESPSRRLAKPEGAE
ncbi:hypothetical protein GB937_004500 [Aspergillus fischeri]|nr:hypothetical protein GB937_004500 [Aspergillus fischeri]